ncbi:hypothetical protein RJT34_28564 [Clitoria ternatea]|uniref:Uncharacterized protein n=1 Tax=Clitoria ternatea TaxID=43366 RepID=A0AAN9F8X2_CLITE
MRGDICITININFCSIKIIPPEKMNDRFAQGNSLTHIIDLMEQEQLVKVGIQGRAGRKRVTKSLVIVNTSPIGNTAPFKFELVINKFRTEVDGGWSYDFTPVTSPAFGIPLLAVKLGIGVGEKGTQCNEEDNAQRTSILSCLSDSVEKRGQASDLISCGLS